MTQVFNGTGPGGTYTDLDLSGVVGANYALVLLKFVVIYTSDGSCGVSVRTKGDTASVKEWSNGKGASGAAFDTGNQAYFLVETDSSGKIQWTDDGLTNTVVITVAGYIK